jgi:hypothetical protein
MSLISTKLSKNTGNFIVITGIMHLIIGVIEYQEALFEILRLGIINTADKNLQTFGFFWFEINGFFVIFAGAFIQHYINEFKKQIPGKFGWYLLAIAVFGCLLEPLSGFYVYVLIAAMIIVQNKKAAICNGV